MRPRVNSWISVREHLLICSEQTKAFVSRLNYQKAVERVMMSKLECFDAGSMINADGKRPHIICEAKLSK